MEAAATLLLSALVAAAYCAQAVTEAMIGPVLPDLAQSRGYSIASLAVLIPAYNTGGSIGTAFGGILFDRFTTDDSTGLPRGAVALLAGIMVVVASFAAAMSVPASREIMIIISFCQGAGGGVFRTGANWLMMKLHDESAGPWIQTIHFCSGVGRWWAGLLGSYFISTKNLQGAFLSGAAIVFAVAVPLLVIALLGDGSGAGGNNNSKQLKEKAGTEADKTPNNKSTDLFLILFSSFVFVLLGIQNSFQYLVTSYAVAASPPLEYKSPALAALLSASYGLAFAVSRLVSIPAAVYFPDPLLRLKLSAVVSLGALIAITMRPASEPTLENASMALGLALAPAFPTAIIYGKQTLGSAMTGGKLSLLMSAGTLGGVFVPQLAGQFVSVGGERAWGGPEVMMQMLSVVCLGGLGLLFAASWAAPKEAKSKAE